jgi:hypothetical protein
MKKWKADILSCTGEVIQISGGTTEVYLASEVDARIANTVATYSLRNADLEHRIVELEQQLAMANDAAAKGEKARLEAAGMQEQIAELEKYEHLCRLALTSLEQGQSVQFGSAWHEQLRSLMGSVTK